MNIIERIVKEVSNRILDTIPDKENRVAYITTKENPYLSSICEYLRSLGYTVTRKYGKYSVTIYVYPMGDN